MFKHLSKLFDHADLPVLINRYERLRTNGELAEAEAIRANISHILANGRKNHPLNPRN
jgi:PBP1b-binding outer membrane lipoprotein LpoB